LYLLLLPFVVNKSLSLVHAAFEIVKCYWLWVTTPVKQYRGKSADFSLYLYEQQLSNTWIVCVQVYPFVQQLDTEALQERSACWRVAGPEHVALRWFQAVSQVSCFLV